MSEVKNIKRILKFYGVLFGIMFIICGVSCIINKQNIKQKNIQIESLKKTNLILKDSIERIYMADSVYQYLMSFNNLKHKDIIYNQFKIESANFTSSLFKRNNNLAGMTMPYKRPTTALYDSGGYAYYNNWRMSIIDYALYQTYMMRNSDTSRSDYLKILNSYAEDPNYIKVIR